MTYIPGVLVGFLFFFIVGAGFGFAVAQSNVADKCLCLGGFYVGAYTFECKEKK